MAEKATMTVAEATAMYGERLIGAAVVTAGDHTEGRVVQIISSNQKDRHGDCDFKIDVNKICRQGLHPSVRITFVPPLVPQQESEILTVAEALAKYTLEQLVGREFKLVRPSPHWPAGCVCIIDSVNEHEVEYSRKDAPSEGSFIRGATHIKLLPMNPAYAMPAPGTYEEMTVAAAWRKYGAGLTGEEIVSRDNKQWGRLHVIGWSAGDADCRDLANGDRCLIPSSAVIWIIDTAAAAAAAGSTWKRYEAFSELRRGHRCRRADAADAAYGEVVGGLGDVVTAIVRWSDGSRQLHPYDALEYDAGKPAGNDLPFHAVKELPLPEPPPPPEPKKSALAKRIAGLDYGDKEN